MFYEYALDPACVARWHSREIGRYFRDAFARCSGRMVSRFPASWGRRVIEEFERLQDDGLTPEGRQQAEQYLKGLVKQLQAEAVSRGRPGPDPASDWIAAALAEHARLRFRAIVSRRSTEPSVLPDRDLGEMPHPLWDVPASVMTPRVPEELVKALGQLLECSRHIVFVDPYFWRQNARASILRHFLSAAVQGRSDPPNLRCEVRTGEPDESLEFFEDTCRKELPGEIPRGLMVECHLIRQWPGGEKVHNRYVLTDLGGVVYGTGLDHGLAGETDDIARLSHEAYLERWRQYVVEERNMFDVFATFSIEGTARWTPLKA